MKRTSFGKRAVEVSLLVLIVIGSLLTPRTLSSNEMPNSTTLQTSKASPEPPVYKNSHALIIGQSTYKSWDPLPGAKRDVQEVAKVLKEHGFNVTVVMDPTYDEFNKAFDNFKSIKDRANPSRFLFYFSGHGYTAKTDLELDFGYIVPSDAPSPLKDMPGFTGKAISMNIIEAKAREISPIHALFVFDSCFSGSLFTTTRGIPDSISERTKQPVRLFITAGTENQKVPDDSVFRQAFVRGLQGAADRDKNGYVTGSELGEFLMDKVTDYSRGAQTPRYGKIRDPKLDQGDIVFDVRGRIPPPEPPKPAPIKPEKPRTEQSKLPPRRFEPFTLESRYYASGWMGDIAGPDNTGKLIYSKQATTIEERSTVEIRLDYKTGNKGWAGIFWQHPENNWGDEPGLNLTGAKRITFYAKGERGGEIVEFNSGGIGKGKPYPDAFKKILGEFPLSKDWTKYVIDLSDLSEKDLASVIGGFAWFAKGGYDKDGRMVVYLADLRVE